MSKKLYISYGSNLDRAQMALRCPDAKVVGMGILHGWRLLFRRFATIEPMAGRNTPVLVWEISPRDERSLDLYEGYPRFYTKQELEVDTFPADGSGMRKLTAMVYIMTDGYPAKAPSPDYYETLAEAYRIFHFPAHVLSHALEESIGREEAQRFLKWHGFSEEAPSTTTFQSILEKDSGLYTGTDEDGQTVTVQRQKGVGFSISRPTHDDWFEVLHYDENGELEGVSYER